MRLSKSQFSRAIEAKSVATVEPGAVPASPNPSKRASRILITALIAAIGLGAGWIGGKVLNARSGVPVEAYPSDVPPTEQSSSAAQSPSASLPAKRNAGAENSDASKSLTAPEAELPAVTPEPPAKDASPKAALPKVPAVEKEEESGAGAAAAEDPAKEIGRKALKKMAKENEKMKRDPGNKNENDKN